MPEFGARVVNDPVLQSPVIELSYPAEDPRRRLQVGIAPHQGSNLLQFRVGSSEVFSCDRQALSAGGSDGWTGCFVLWPLPNRHNLDGRKAYAFQGQEVSVDDIVRKPDDRYLIHGLVDDQKWEYDEPVAGPDFAVATTRIAIDRGSDLYRHFPWESSLTLTYTLRSDRVEVTYTAANFSDRPMPHVFALHPYYELFGGPEHTRVRIPAERRMVADAETVPTGEVREVDGAYDLRNAAPVGDRQLDDVWTGMRPGEDTYVEYDDPALRVRHVVTPDFTHAVLYTLMAQKLNFVCLEPQTGSSNAINLDARARATGDTELEQAAHLIVVPPGGTQTGTAAFVVEHL